MSSTKGDVIAQEHYPTPVNAIKALLDQLVILPNDKFLEPCRAAGIFTIKSTYLSLKSIGLN